MSGMVQASGGVRRAVFDENGSFIVPSETVWVSAVGGGQAASAYNSAGGGPGVSVGPVKVSGLTVGAVVGVVVGAAGVTEGQVGSSSAFGAYVTAAGGSGMGHAYADNGSAFLDGRRGAGGNIGGRPAVAGCVMIEW